MVQEEGRGEAHSLINTLERINSKLDVLEPVLKKKEKKFKLPGLGGWKNKVKKGWVLAQIIKENMQVEFKFLPIERDLVYLPQNKTFHLATAEFMLRYDKYPMVIIPERQMEPLHPKLLYDGTLTVDNTTNTSGQLALLNKFMSGQVQGKKPGIGKMWIIIGVLAVVAIYIIAKALGVKLT